MSGRGSVPNGQQSSSASSKAILPNSSSF
ncbi:hypothetical protein LINPERPRIM_LOCUS30335 [Linum perenne]